MAKKAAADGAKIVVAAKTADPHPKLPGTIYTAAEEIKKFGTKSIAIKTDIRFDDQIENAFNEELSKILKAIKIEEVPSNYSTFYEKNLLADKKQEIKITFNNKIVHQSKLLKYFTENQEIKKVQKMKKNKVIGFFGVKDKSALVK